MMKVSDDDNGLVHLHYNLFFSKISNVYLKALTGKTQILLV